MIGDNSGMGHQNTNLESGRPYIIRDKDKPDEYIIIEGEGLKGKIDETIKREHSDVYKAVYKLFGERISSFLGIEHREVGENTYFITRSALNAAFDKQKASFKTVKKSDVDKNQNPGLAHFDNFENEAIEVNRGRYFQGETHRHRIGETSALAKSYASSKKGGDAPVAHGDVKTLSKEEGKPKVTTMRGDISRIPTDVDTHFENKNDRSKLAFINAANDNLQGVGTTGTNRSLYHSSPTMWESTRSVLRNRLGITSLGVGQATQTLRNDGSHVIHTLGPEHASFGNNEKKYDQVYMATYNALLLAKENGVTHVLMPEISTGKFSGGPEWDEKANEAQMQAIEDFIANEESSGIEEIRVIQYENYNPSEQRVLDHIQKAKGSPHYFHGLGRDDKALLESYLESCSSEVQKQFYEAKVNSHITRSKDSSDYFTNLDGEQETEYLDNLKRCGEEVQTQGRSKYLIEKAIRGLEDELEVEGIFRISGMKDDLNSVKLNPQSIKEAQVHVKTGILKEALGEYLAFGEDQKGKVEMVIELLDSLEVEDEKYEENKQKIISVLKEIVNDNNDPQLLKKLFKLLKAIAEHEDKNKMSEGNLSIVIGPKIISKLGYNPMELGLKSAGFNNLAKFMIENVDEIFAT